MKKSILLFGIFAFLTSFCANAQVLYKISGKGLTKPSFLMGTFHLAQPSFADSIPGYHRAFDMVGQVYGEVVTADAKKAENIKKMTDAMMLPDSMSLENLFTDSEMQRLNAFSKELMGADLTHPMMKESFGKMKPSGISTAFTVLLYQKFLPEAFTGEGIDEYVQNQAIKHGKMVGGLETIDDQLDALFNLTPIERQAKSLICIVDNKEYNLSLTKQIIEAYYAQDLEKIEKLTEMKLGDDCDATDEENEILVTGRNKAWMIKIPSLMAEKPTMFVVGAAHLVGEEGLISLLRNAGYTVTPVAGLVSKPISF